MAHTVYYHNPRAPAANSILVAVTAFVQDDADRLLMTLRIHDGQWTIAGGVQRVGDTITAAVVRGVREECGLLVEVTGLVGINSHPDHVIAFDTGEVRQQFSLCFRAQPIGGSLVRGVHSREVCWMPREDMGALSIEPTVAPHIERGFQHRPEPHIG